MQTTGVDRDDATRELLRTRPATAVFHPGELDGLAEPARRYLEASIATGTPIATAARLRMRGRIRLGRWVPFTAREVIAPHRGFVWQARAAGVISGHDAYLDGRGTMRWKALGLVTVVDAAGPDVATSAAGRCGAEAIWLPTALLPRFGVAWSTRSADHIVASFMLHTTPIELHLGIDETGLPTSIVLDRWGDPDRTGAFGWHRFGGEISAHETFHGLTVPSAGWWGWHPGTPDWSAGEFFRCRVTDHQPR